MIYEKIFLDFINFINSYYILLDIRKNFQFLLGRKNFFFFFFYKLKILKIKLKFF
jgi:hypothetical protein